MKIKQLAIDRLTGRRVVEFTVQKGEGSIFFPTCAGEPKSIATIQVVIDGYSAPMTAGNFFKLVLDRAFHKRAPGSPFIQSGLGGISFDEGHFSVYGLRHEKKCCVKCQACTRYRMPSAAISNV